MATPLTFEDIIEKKYSVSGIHLCKLKPYFNGTKYISMIGVRTELSKNTFPVLKEIATQLGIYCSSRTVKSELIQTIQNLNRK